MEDINVLINYIEDEIRAKKGTLFASIDKNAILGYTARIRESLPETLSEKRLKEETVKAQNIVAVAEQRREEILNENEIVIEANKRAKEILQNAYDFQNNYATTTMQNIYQMLGDVNDHLKVAQDSIERAMKNLKK